MKMTKRSHNKKRNVGVIYEQLVRKLSQAVVEDDKKTMKECTRILKKHFKKNTELYREFRLFNSLIKTHIDSESLATRIIQEAKSAARAHNVQALDREKSSLIKSINYTFGSGFYKQYISEYKNYATVQKLLNNWRSNSKSDFQELALYESKVHAMLLTKKDNTTMEEHKTEGVSSLTVRLMTEKFNKRYGRILNTEQQELVREYVFSQSSGKTKQLEEKFDSIRSRTLKELKTYSKECSNVVLNEKVGRVTESLNNLNFETMDDSTVAKFLSMAKLCEELKGDLDE